MSLLLVFMAGFCYNFMISGWFPRLVPVFYVHGLPSFLPASKAATSLQPYRNMPGQKVFRTWRDSFGQELKHIGRIMKVSDAQ